MSTVEKTVAPRSFYSQIKGYDRLMQVNSPAAGRLTIYSNPEQLALVSSDGFREHVKYIEYRNIRAVLLERHSLTMKALLLLLVLAGILALVFLDSEGLTAGFVAWVISLSILFGAITLSLRSCSVRIVTDVYDHQLLQVSRYRQARQLLAMISHRMEPYLEPPAETSTVD